MPFIGKQSTSNSQITNYTTTVGSGGQTNFTVIIEGGDETHVYLNGVLLKETTDYTVSSTQVSLVSPAVENDIVEIKVFRSFALSDAVRASEGGTFSGNVAVNGDLTVDTDTLKVDSTNNVVGINKTPTGTDKLQVKGTISSEATNSTNKWLAYTYTDNSYRLNYNGAGDDEVVIDSSGNFGIGTASPDAKLTLDVPSYDSSSTNGMIRFQNSNNTSDACVQSYYVSGEGAEILLGTNAFINTSGGHDRFDNTNETSSIYIRRDGTIRFHTNSTGGVGQERMQITSEGYVLKNNHPFFCGRGNHSNANVTGSYNAIIFHNNDVTNNAISQNSSTGKCGIPVSGKYMINWTVGNQGSGNNGSYLGLSILKNNGIEVSGWSVNTGYDHTTHCQVILNLSSSDTVAFTYRTDYGAPPSSTSLTVASIYLIG